jgi:hypothetical protein
LFITSWQDKVLLKYLSSLFIQELNSFFKPLSPKYVSANINSLFKNDFQEKVSSKVWLKLHEFKLYFNLTIWACGAEGKQESILIFLKRIKSLYKGFGKPRGSALYLKECLRLTIYFLAGQQPLKTNGPSVKCDSHGLPTIIPWLLRKELLSFKERDLKSNKGVVVCILTLLSVFRIFDVKAKPNLGSILKPFSGTIRSIDLDMLKLALHNLGLRSGSLRLKAPKLLLIEKASPNASKSTWSSSLDAVAFLFYPETLKAYILYAYNFKGLKWVVWLLLIITVAFPLLIILKLFKVSPHLVLAKLGVVHDQSGKARIVGITNYWIQIILKPLHDAILSLLKEIPMDGTFNQVAPVNRLMSMKQLNNQKFYSFDLSSATDRLPVDVQADILNLLVPNLGSLWKSLLGSLRWLWISSNRRVKDKEVKYSVGQPMGAYSSWAMLALSHHIIVQVAAINCGIRSFSSYAVLGDDIVIADDRVAKQYLLLMNLLGVQINLSKSLTSDKFCEFAKRWIGPSGLDLSPIGPGLILRTVRAKSFMPSLLALAWLNGLIPSIEALLAYINNLPSFYRGQKVNTLWAAFGISSFVMKGSQNGNNNFMSLLSWCFSLSKENMSSAPFLIKSALVQVIIQDRAKAYINLDDAIKYFGQNWWSTMTARGWPNRMLEFLLKAFGPGIWAYILNFQDQKARLDDALGAVSSDYSYEGLVHTILNDPFAINVQNINWQSREQVRATIDRGHAIVKAFDQQLEDLMFINGDFY